VSLSGARFSTPTPVFDKLSEEAANA